jgi:hypothetical protein
MKPFSVLKRLIQERLAPTVAAERDGLIVKLNDIVKDRHRDRILHHHPHRVSGNVTIVKSGKDSDDQNVVSRVTAAYRKSLLTPVGSTNSMWLTNLADMKVDAQDLLEKGDPCSIGQMLRDPISSMLLFGFHTVHKIGAAKNKDSSWHEWQRRSIYDNLLQITRAIGIRRVENPETEIDFDDTPTVESLLDSLDAVFGFKIEFPNIFAGEIGLETSRGVVTYRAVQALYLAWRIRQIVRDAPTPRILEIGAGLGYAAYFAVRMGIRSYTIIDIPLTGVAQGYFLCRVLGEDQVSLFGEDTDAAVKILPPAAFHQGSERFDLIVNVDSLTEMAESTAREYFDAARTKCSRFLSINHECNPFTVAQNYQGRDDVRVSRSLYWLRRGYVEELIEFV